jgi:hypothetical protein
MLQMSGLDLNAYPTKDVNVNDMELEFCTQVVPAKMVRESLDPMVHDQGWCSDVHSGRGHSFFEREKTLLECE